MSKLQRITIRFVLGRIPRAERQYRIILRGRRLLVKQYQWLHFNVHPWDCV